MPEDRDARNPDADEAGLMSNPCDDCESRARCPDVRTGDEEECSRLCRDCNNRYTSQHEEPCLECLVHHLRTKERNTLWVPKVARELDFFKVLETAWGAFLAAMRDAEKSRKAFNGILGLVVLDENDKGEIGCTHATEIPMLGTFMYEFVRKTMDELMDTDAMALMAVTQGEKFQREYPPNVKTAQQRADHDKTILRGPPKDGTGQAVLHAHVYFQTGHVVNFTCPLPKENPLGVVEAYGMPPGTHKGGMVPSVCNNAQEIQEC